jgi:hypothetical protein
MFAGTVPSDVQQDSYRRDEDRDTLVAVLRALG